jgi:hypothetical protein
LSSTTARSSGVSARLISWLLFGLPVKADMSRTLTPTRALRSCLQTHCLCTGRRYPHSGISCQKSTKLTEISTCARRRRFALEAPRRSADSFAHTIKQHAQQQQILATPSPLFPGPSRSPPRERGLLFRQVELDGVLAPCSGREKVSIVIEGVLFVW